MWTTMWVTSVLVLLVADIRTGALQNKELKPQQCYQCSNANVTTCILQKVAISCSAEQPYCGTVAVGPSFASLLKCLPAFKSSCSMNLTTNSKLELSCVCSGLLCNAPFSKRTQNKLLKFAKLKLVDNSNDITKDFFKYFNLENATDVYKIVTADEQDQTIILNPIDTTTSTVTKLTELLKIDTNNSIEILPHAEPLKHEATVPPDDDEDETEGSGSYDDTKSQKNTASAPAAPSSYLPAEENKASHVVKNTLAIVSLIVYTINV